MRCQAVSEKSEFWNRVILPWEERRYRASRGWMTSLFSSSVQARSRQAVALLAPRVAGKTILEVGCGTGRLAKTFLDLGARHYIGLDFSSVALIKAKELGFRAGLSSRTEFILASATDLPDLDFDICLSLGLLDWLTPVEIKKFAEATSGSDFVHSYSEARAKDLLRLVHERYVYLKYGRRQDYVPLYYSEGEIRSLLGLDVEIHRHGSMRFGSLAIRFHGRDARHDRNHDDRRGHDDPLFTQ